ncbi:MAG: hypothetical protein KDD77_09480, partial [Caldilineaceae bacterium]|nr:hypothetical protein [Caldilinea sp.]MCB0067371.1 hypothetical protein [Caldilineaceae bacterium]
KIVGALLHFGGRIFVIAVERDPVLRGHGGLIGLMSGWLRSRSSYQHMRRSASTEHLSGAPSVIGAVNTGVWSAQLLANTPHEMIQYFIM